MDTVEDTEVKYVASYRYPDSDDWYIAGDIYGYPTRGEAMEALHKEVAKGPQQKFKGTGTHSISEVQVLKFTTTSKVVHHTSL